MTTVGFGDIVPHTVIGRVIYKNKSIIIISNFLV